MTETSSVYEAAGGDAGMLALASAWHERVLVDEVVGHAFSHGFDEHHTERLAAYFGEALGGPPTFSRRYGDESGVERMHAGNGRHREMDDRAIACFDRALDDVGVEPGSRLRDALHDYFAWATRTAMADHPRSRDDVPDGLSIPRWSWDGLVRT
ncbi:MAG: oxidoreductase [Propionibacteriaceae bacterium]|nr:MAG: oxidoreductase [Propionibacteriaceae bacterium]